MAIMCNKRKSVRHLWSALIFTTIIGCAAFIYLSLNFGKHHFETRRSGDFFARQERLTEETCIQVCDSKECVHQSKILLNKVNPSVDPCENFFEFVCGKYLENKQKESDSFFTRTSEKFRGMLKDLLDNIKADPNSASGKMKTLYDSCMKKSSDLEAIPTVLQFLTQFGIPHWPNLEPDFKFDDSSRQSVLSKFLVHQEYAFVDISSKYVYREDFYADANATIQRNREGVYEKKEKSARKYLVERVLQYFNLDTETISGIWNESEVIRDAITLLKEESENETSPLILIDCTLDAETEWKTMCEFLETFVDMADANSGVSKRFAEVYGRDIYFLQNIFSVLDNFSDRSIANYLALNFLLNHMSDINFYFRLTLLKDPSDVAVPFGNVHTQIGRWQHCSEWIQKRMFIALGHEYMKTVFTTPIIEEVEDLINEIMREVAEEISSQEWITEPHREKLKENTESIFLSITMLKDILLNDTLINRVYEQFHPAPGNFIRNVLEYQKYSKIEEMRGILQVMDMIWIRSSILETEAFGGSSSIEIGFGLLLSPLYIPYQMRLINSVSLSTVVAHEIGHTMQQFYYRNLVSEERKIWNETKICLDNQYSQFRFESIGKNVNGSRYRRENEADVIAVSIIDKFIEKHAYQEDSLMLPAFPYLSQQMLYISSMQVWCASVTEKDEEFNFKKDSHSLPKFRMLGMMQNSKGFAKAFNCSQGSYMNPSTKCAFFRD